MKTKYENNYYWSQQEKNKYLTTTCIIHGLYEEKSLIKISLIQDSSTEKTIHATSNFNFHDSVDWNILWYKKFIQS